MHQTKSLMMPNYYTRKLRAKQSAMAQWIGRQLQSKTITQAPKKDVGVTVVVRHDTVPEQSDIKIIDRPKTQRERYNVRDVPSGSWPVLIDRGIKAESCTN